MPIITSATTSATTPAACRIDPHAAPSGPLNATATAEPASGRLVPRGWTRRAWLGAVPAAAALGLPGLSGAQEPSAFDKIKASGALKVAVYRDNAPFSESISGTLKGVDVDLAAALAQQLQLRPAMLPFDAGENMNDDLRNMVWRGHYLGYGPADVMLHVPVDRYLINENRQALIFAPYCRVSLLVLHDTTRIADVRSPEDLKGQRLAAERGSGAASVLVGYGGGMLREQVGFHLSGLQAAQAVLKGEAAAAYVSRAQAEAALFRANEKSGRFQLAPMALPGMPENGWPVGLAIKADNKPLALALEDALKALRASGQMLSIFREHGLTLAAP